MKKIVRFVSYFLVGLLVMQAVFSANSSNSKAAHSSKSTLYIANNMELKRTGNEDRSMQSILKDYVRLKHHAMFIKEAGKSNYTTAYCIDFSKTAKSGGTLNADMKIDATQERLINYTMLYGFNHKSFNVTCGTKADTEHFFATQVLIWIIRTGNFYNDANRTKLENYFFKAWPSVKSRYQTIYQKVKYQDMLPSYAGITVNGQESSCGKFEWDTCTNTYKSGSNSANTTVKVDKSSLPCGVDVQICGEQVKITSTKEVTKETKIRFTKAPNMKGKVVCWNVAVAGQQPQATLDYDMDPIAREFTITILPVQGKKETPKPTTAPPTETTCPPVATTVPPCQQTEPPTPEPTTAPPCQQSETPELITCPPCKQTETPTCPVPETPVCPEEPKVEIPEKTVEEVVEVTEDKLDEVPKTADSSNLNLVIMLLGAAVIAMVISAAPVVIRKFRRY